MSSNNRLLVSLMTCELIRDPSTSEFMIPLANSPFGQLRFETKDVKEFTLRSGPGTKEYCTLYEGEYPSKYFVQVTRKKRIIKAAYLGGHLWHTKYVDGLWCSYLWDVSISLTVPKSAVDAAWKFRQRT